MRYSEVPMAPVDSPAPDTLQWATKLLDGHANFIHVLGAPGSGKSVLCSYLAKQSKASNSTTVTLSFCFSRSDNRRRTAEDLVFSFLLQAFVQYPSKLEPKTVRTIFAVVGMFPDRKPLDMMWGLLRTILESLGDTKVFFIIDALEECNETIEQLLKYMAHIHIGSETEYKFIITSRPMDRIDSILKQIEEAASNFDQDDALEDVCDDDTSLAFLRFDLDSEPDIETDKRRFIEQRKRNAALIRDPSVLEVLSLELHKRSFLELKLILDTILDPDAPPMEAMASIMGATSSELENGVLHSLYETFLSDIPPQERAWADKVLSWLMFAERPLTTKQLSVALAVDCYPISSTQTWKVERLMRPNFEADLHYALGKLIRVEGYEVYLAHPTVRDFLEAREMENRLAADCLRYISFQDPGWGEVLQACEIPPQLRLPNSRPPSQEFLAYSALHWATPLRKSNDNHQVVAQALKFLRSGAVAFWGEAYWTLKEPAATQIKPSWDQPLQVAAHLGLTSVVKIILAENPNQDKSRALPIAVQAGHKDIIQILMAHDGSLWGLVLTQACAFSHTSIVELVLQAGQASLLPLDQCLIIAIEQSCSEIAGRLIDELFDTEQNAQDKINNIRSPSGDTPLILAARLGNELIVKMLLERGVDTSAMNDENHTALHVAASCGQLAVVRALLKKMRETELQNNDWDFQPLHLAARFGYETVVRALLQRQVDPNAKAKSYGVTPLHLAASYNHPEVAEILLEATEESPVDKQGLTPLIIACAEGYLEVVKVLLEHCANTEVTVRGANSRTALHFAARGGHADVVEALLDDGANQDAVTVPDEETALHEAIRNGHLEVVQVLLEEGADVDLPQLKGLTALHIAAKEGNAEIVESLLEHFADPDVLDKEERSAIQIAAESKAPGASAVLQLLLAAETDDTPGELEKKTKLPPLILAALADNMRLLELAIEEDPDVTKRGSDGATALHIAARNGYYSLARQLLSMENGLSPNLPDNAGRSALHVAAEARDVSADFLKLLLTYHADIDAQTAYGQTALHISIANGNGSTAEFLIDSGADVNAESYDDSAKLFSVFRPVQSFQDEAKVLCELHTVTPLHIAAYQGNEDIVRRLLVKGANILARAADGSTPLHLAVQGQHNGTCQILLEKGGNTTELDDRCPTALFMVAYYGNHSILALFPPTDLSAMMPWGYWGSPFQAAILGGHQAVLEIFGQAMGENPMVVFSPDAHGWTPLHCVPRSGEVIDDLDAAIVQQYPAYTPVQRPNPTSWSTAHRNPFVQLDDTGLEAACTVVTSSVPVHTAALRHRRFCVQADHPFSGTIYFEVKVLANAMEK
jgi:ankyrin repeat protein